MTNIQRYAGYFEGDKAKKMMFSKKMILSLALIIVD